MTATTCMYMTNIIMLQQLIPDILWTTQTVRRGWVGIIDRFNCFSFLSRSIPPSICQNPSSHLLKPKLELITQTSSLFSSRNQNRQKCLDFAASVSISQINILSFLFPLHPSLNLSKSPHIVHLSKPKLKPTLSSTVFWRWTCGSRWDLN